MGSIGRAKANLIAENAGYDNANMKFANYLFVAYVSEPAVLWRSHPLTEATTK